MGAGYGCGPHEQRQPRGWHQQGKERSGGEGGGGEREFRHEHAADEQRFRYRDVAERGLI